MVRVDKRSLRIAVRDADFPDDVDVGSVMSSLERDIISAMRAHGVERGTVTIGVGDFNYDIHPGGVVKRGGKRGKKEVK